MEWILSVLAAGLACFAAGYRMGAKAPGGGESLPTEGEVEEAFRCLQNYSAAAAYRMGGETL